MWTQYAELTGRKKSFECRETPLSCKGPDGKTPSSVRQPEILGSLGSPKVTSPAPTPYKHYSAAADNQPDVGGLLLLVPRDLTMAGVDVVGVGLQVPGG